MNLFKKPKPKGQIMFAVYTPRMSLLGLFNSKWKAEQAERLWNYPCFVIKRVWVNQSGDMIFDISEHSYKIIHK